MRVRSIYTLRVPVCPAELLDLLAIVHGRGLPVGAWSLDVQGRDGLVWLVLRSPWLVPTMRELVSGVAVAPPPVSIN